MKLIKATKETTWYLTVEGVEHPMYGGEEEYRTDDSGGCWEVGVGDSWEALYSDDLIRSLRDVFAQYRNPPTLDSTHHPEVLLYRKIKDFVSGFSGALADDETLDLVSDGIMDIFIHESSSVSTSPISLIGKYTKLRDFLSGYVNVPLDEISLNFLVDHSIDIITLKENV